MTRFQPQGGARIAYAPIQPEKPLKQLIGLYGMWQSLSPETRERIGNWFRKKGTVSSDLNPAVDTTLTYQEIPELGSKALWRTMVEQATGMPIDWTLTEEAPRPERYPAVGVDTSVMSPFGMSEDSTWLLK